MSNLPINRRDFARLAAAASAAALLPSSVFSQAAAPSRKVRYAVVGLGRISVQHFMPGTRMGNSGQITALVSGDPAKARKLAAEYGVAESSIYSYANFDSIRNNPEIDAVYIGLPNSMHAEYTVRAAQAGKHVLCEKPMATSVADCDRMIAACSAANKLLMIAYRCQLQTTYLQAQKLVQSGALGKIQAIESANGFNIGPDWRLNGKLAGGGPLMDMGVYSLNACRFLLGEEPSQISAYTSVIDHDGRFNEVEENCAWTMKFPSGVVAACSTTYGANMEGFITLHGSKGTLTVNGFGYDGISMTLRRSGPYRGMSEQSTEADNSKDPSQFIVESDYFSQCILGGTKPGPSGEEGRKDVALMMKIYESAKRTS